MKITVVGSYRRRTKHALLLNERLFRTACERIGRELAGMDHELVVSHAEDPNTAEMHALRGFVSAGSNHYHKCSFHKGDPPLKAHMEAVEKSDAVILLGGFNGTYAAGLGALRRRKLVVPIPVFGGSAKDLCEIPDIDYMLVDEIRNLEMNKPKWEDRLTKSLRSVLNAYPRVLIIHGRGDDGAKLCDKVLAVSKEKDSPLEGMVSPVIMNLRGKGALSLPDVFESLASQVSAAIAIVTADDVGGFARADMPGRQDYSARDLRLGPRARENVWVEVGWFWGRLGRHRVLLWLKEEIQLPTDLQGAAWTHGDLDHAWDSIEAFLQSLRQPITGRKKSKRE